MESGRIAYLTNFRKFGFLMEKDPCGMIDNYPVLKTAIS